MPNLLYLLCMDRLPLPPTPPDTFAMLPEYIFEDVTELFLFVAK